MYQIKNVSRIVALIALGLYLFSCNNAQFTESDLIIIDINKLKARNPLDIDNNGVFDSCRFVKLETNELSLLGDVKKILITDSLFFVSDENNKLLVFDHFGQFKNAISNIGSGPNEILSLTDFCVDEKLNSVYIYDAVALKLYEYSFDGELTNVVDVKSDYFGVFSSMQVLKNGDLLLIMFNQKESRYNYRVLSKAKRFKQNIDLLKYRVVGDDFISFGSEQKIGVNDHDVFALSFLSDTIYTFTDNNYTLPKFVYRGNLAIFEIYDKLDRNISQDVTLFVKKLRDENYSLGLTNLFCTNEYLLFNSFENETQYSVFWSIKENEGCFVKDYFSYNIFSSIGQIKTTYKNAFVSYIPAYKAIDCQGSEYRFSDKKIEAIVEDLNEEDNPIIGFYYIKKV